MTNIRRPRRNLLLILTALFVALSLVLVFFLSGAFWRPKSTVLLPDPAHAGPDGMDGLSPVYLNEPAEYLAMELTVDNILSVLRALKRPAAYSAVYQSTLSAGGDTLRTHTAVFVKEGAARYEVTPGKGRAYTQIVTADTVYSFPRAGGKPVVQTARSTLADDRLGGLPSYEELADGTARITACRTEEEGGVFFLLVAAQNGVFTETYKISLADGLLFSMEAVEDGVSVFQTMRASLDTTPPEDALFREPS